MKKELDYKAMWEKLYELVNERTITLDHDYSVAIDNDDKVIADVINEQRDEVYAILNAMLILEEYSTEGALSWNLKN